MTIEQWKKNREILTWVKRQIRTHPNRYNQSSFCGSVCCIGGWVDIRVNGARAHAAKMPGLVSEDARLALGIDLRAYLWLFNGNLYGGPREIYMQALDSLAKGKCITVPLAIRAINAWLKETKPQ